MSTAELDSRAWLAIRSPRGAFSLRWQGLVRGKPTSLPRALKHPSQWVLVEDGDWIYLFSPRGGAPLPLALDPVALSRVAEEVCWFSLRESLWARRYRDGAVVRRVERTEQGELSQEGRPGKKLEPSLDPFDSDSVIGMAAAWHCDPRPLLRGKPRAWLLVPRPARERPRTDWPAVATIFFLVFLLMGIVLSLEANKPSRRPFEVDLENVVLGALAPCYERPTCEMCASCSSVDGGACASQFRACERDQDCTALQSCFTRCGTERMQRFLELKGHLPPEGFQLDFGCDEVCADEHPAGAKTYRAWKTCTSCDACSELCAWQIQLGVGDSALADCAVSREDTEDRLGR